jgi:hypothetical protein
MNPGFEDVEDDTDLGPMNIEDDSGHPDSPQVG